MIEPGGRRVGGGRGKEMGGVECARCSAGSAKSVHVPISAVAAFFFSLLRLTMGKTLAQQTPVSVGEDM